VSSGDLQMLFLFLMLLGNPGLILQGCSQPQYEVYIPGKSQLLEYHRDQLEHRYPVIQFNGIVGTARLGNEAVEAVPSLKDIVRKRESYAALWGLAKIDLNGERDFLQEYAKKAEQQLLDGGFPEIAFHTAFLAAYYRGNRSPGFFNNVLPELYNSARGNDPGDRLLAAWALYEIDTDVTRERADGAIRDVASSLNPDDGMYTRLLTYIRLIGRPALPLVSNKLNTLIKNYDFGTDWASKKAQTVATLAALQYPDAPDVLASYQQELADALDSPLSDDTALSKLRLAGPYLCSDKAVTVLKKEIRSENDRSDREEMQWAVDLCQR